jgi:endonuclease-3 related protein
MKKQKIRKIYDKLDKYFGDLGWWPADSAFEVIVGAVLTQNTAWKNVEKAIEQLKQNKLLDPKKIESLSDARLSRLIRSSGYHRVKSERLKAVCRFLEKECGSRLNKLKKAGAASLRKKLLSVKGIGPETADSILVYAFSKPVFVVDAYTRRIFSRHGLAGKDASYDEVQSVVHENFPTVYRKLNQFHALLVETGKRFCKKKKGLCKECPIKGL